MIKGYLKISVLNELLKSDCSGYGLMSCLEKTFGKKPSSGSMYPLLKELESEKFIKSKTIGRTKIYSLTVKGKKDLDELCKKKAEVTKNQVQLLKIYEKISKEKDIDQIIKGMEKIRCSDDGICGLARWKEFHRLVIKLVTSKDYKKKEIQILNILDDTIVRLKKV